MEKVILKAIIRGELGKAASRHARKDGKIPAVVYKGGKQGLNVEVDSKALWHALHTEAGENAVITLDISGDDKQVKKTVIVQDVQQDPLNDKFLHVDFHEISLKEKIKVDVPVVVKGEAKGVTDENGVLAQAAWELAVECLPTAIPESIVVHVEELGMNEAIHVKDLKVPEGVKVLDDPEDVVVAVHPPQAEEVEEEAVEGEEGVEEPEVIKKGKGEEEGEASEEGGE